MRRFTGKLPILRALSTDQIQKWSGEYQALLKSVIEKEAVKVEAYVDHVRELNSGIDQRDLARKIMSRRAMKAGGIGALCSLGGFLAMPITMPGDMYMTFRIQARMVLAVAYIYGWDVRDDDFATDILLVMGGSAGISALKKLGIKIGQEYTKKVVAKRVKKEMVKQLNQLVSRKIITKAGEKRLVNFTKLVPLVGAPIGGALNYFGTLDVGRRALKFYQR
ncbi:MAG: EcsC family protein [Planctomycetota bacterium]|jgi:uncharacterized protein (DUF697 family)